MQSMNEREEGELTSRPTERANGPLFNSLPSCCTVLLYCAVTRAIKGCRQRNFWIFNLESPRMRCRGMVCEIVFAVADTRSNFPSSKIVLLRRPHAKIVNGSENGVADPSLASLASLQ